MSGGVSVVVVLDVLCIGSAEGSRLDSIIGIPVIGVDVSGTDTGDFVGLSVSKKKHWRICFILRNSRNERRRNRWADSGGLRRRDGWLGERRLCGYVNRVVCWR